MPPETPKTHTPPESPASTEPTPHKLKHPGAAPWSLRDLIFFVVSAVLALATANLAVLTLYVALQPLAGWSLRPETLRENPFFLLTLQTVFHGLVLAYVYLLIVVNYRQRFWAGLKWRTPAKREAAFFFVGGTFLAVAIQFAPTLLPDREDFPLQRLFSSPEAGYAIAAFAILIAPFMEELIFRGVLFSFFEHLVGVRFAVVGTTILFAALHVPEYWGAWNHVFLVLLAGVVFSLARGLTGSLAPSVILHLAYNATLITVLFFETRQFRAVDVHLIF